MLNATGVVLHTNLGRASAVGRGGRRRSRSAAGHVDVEFDVADGSRARRGRGTLAALRAAVPDAEDVLVVNNGAAALVLATTALAAGREVVVSRGEMVEIGDGFRLPDLIASTGARLREVGTTNRTHLRDYADAIGPETGCVLKVHPSNFRVEGFTSRSASPSWRAWACPVVADTGSGLLAPHPLLPDEPDAATALRAGAAVVTASGDKLLGGPQAGLLLGRADVVERLRRHPLARALRVDKLTLAALEATLRGPVTPTWRRCSPTRRRCATRCVAVADAGRRRGRAERRRGRRRRRARAGAAGLGRRAAGVVRRRDCGPATRASSAGSSATAACSTCGASRPRTTPGVVAGADARCDGVHVVATAGHVDHGKSTLVRALTGMEPDRWAEERRRGMTIDLGYAWTALPGGEVLAFVDVPGHARFIGNMLAGLGPAPAVLVVVAADEGWRRQSGEHLAAVDALGLTAGVLAVTRSDLADPGPATAEALEHAAGLEPGRGRGGRGVGRDRRRASTTCARRSAGS